MPPRGYANLSVRKDLLDRLNQLREQLGFGSISDLLVYLLARIEECNRLEQRLQELEAATRKLYLAVTRLLEEGKGE